MFRLFLRIFLIILKYQNIYANVFEIAPVIYVIFGEIPYYLNLNLELAAR